MANVYFQSRKGSKLVMVITPMGLKDAQGNHIPGKHVYFGLDSKLGPGIAKVSDEQIIKKIRNSELYKSGWIKEVQINPEDVKPKQESPKVKAGIHNSSDIKPK